MRRSRPIPLRRGPATDRVVTVLVPDHPEARTLADVAGRVRLLALGDGAPPDGVEEAEFLVPPWWSPDALAALIPRLNRLRVVQTLSSGVEYVLPAVPPGVTVCNAQGVHDAPVAEWVVAAILAMWKRLPEYAEDQRAGRWSDELPADLAGARVLILGHGSIGRAVEARLAPFGVRIDRVARRARPGVAPVGALDRLLPAADIVVSLLPLTPETAGLLGRERLARMRHGALLVNAGRGGTVDGGALEEALRAGRLRAALDVTDPEPLPAGHGLRSAPGCLITPHVAGRTRSFPASAYRLARLQLERHLRGEPLANVVRPATSGTVAA